MRVSPRNTEREFCCSSASRNLGAQLGILTCGIQKEGAKNSLFYSSSSATERQNIRDEI